MGFLGIIFSLSTLVLLAILFSAYLISLVVYRLLFHPIRHIPGPRLATLTFWYEFYYNVIQRGQYVYKIKSLHDQYGPIVRINPDEVHFIDPDAYKLVYSGANKKRDKWVLFTRGFGIDNSLFSTNPHELHRGRRAALNSLFSKQQVRKMQPTIQERADAMLDRLKGFRDDGGVINLKYASAAFTCDVIMQYAFGNSKKKVNAEDFDPFFHEAISTGFNQAPMHNRLPYMLYAMQKMPKSWLLKLNSNMTSFAEAQKDIGMQVRRILEENASGKASTDRPHTIFDQIIQSKLPPSEKSFSRLAQEGGLVVGAATVGTAWAITVAVFYLVHQPETLKALKTELGASIPKVGEKLDLTVLEHLPYLSAVIQEALRVSIGASHRSQRICPDESVTYTEPDTGRQWHIPPGTPMSLSHILIFQDEKIFPDPLAFKPERWLDDPELDRYQVAFSKGTRNCIGMNLALAEMYLILAEIFRRYGSDRYSVSGDIGALELFETDVSDVTCVGDGGVPYITEGSQGVRFKIKKLGKQ
ncbi:hypothetical protein AJ80_04080 [Polytolypa hystricis UAMH7299]|uniref:Cytochrome P450 n=1 Tax=Polytolypa hystricis (strain UAMH7299) TaxID=1447883 RepID=A0A2B7YFE7_POLH7|nr:hypothetical protein AJ80_04080 [Polytolypa hystricis UAMH7299]